MSARIATDNAPVITVCKGIFKAIQLSKNIINIDESMPFSVAVSVFKVVQPGFFIVDISTITERVANAERTGKLAGRAQRLTPCIVLVFYYKRAGAVKNADDVAL